jgi:hypothetical protein
MPPVDLVDPRETQLSAGMLAIHQRLLGVRTAAVHVHLDGDAVICVTENIDPTTTPDGVRAQVQTAVEQLTQRVLGRGLREQIQSIRPAAGLLVWMLRLGPR